VFFVCLAVAVLAVARVTRLLVEDRLAAGYRRAVVRRWGEGSLPAYLAHCPWCTSIYVALIMMPPAVFLAPGWTEGWGAKLLLSALLVPAASLLAGLILDRK
jgi:hypothetical protein